MAPFKVSGMITPFELGVVILLGLPF